MLSQIYLIPITHINPFPHFQRSQKFHHSRRDFFTDDTMASVCISECVNDACIVPAARPTYVNLQRWSEEEKMSTERRRPRPRAADGIYRRQMYLRSYTFSREDTVVPDSTTQKCLGKIRQRGRPAQIRGGRRRSRCFASMKAAATQASSGALLSMFRRLLCRVVKVTVARGRKCLWILWNQSFLIFLF